MTRRQWLALAGLTLVWGLNWPIMKVGVSGLAGAPAAYPPLTFRAWSVVLGVPVLAVVLVALRVPLALPRAHWGAVALLAVPNLLMWHVLVILGVSQLSSGRTAILGYTMPVFAAMWGVLVFGERLAPRTALALTAAGGGVVLLRAGELTRLSGAPLAAAGVLAAAAAWALGTHLLRRSTLPLHLLSIVFWMTVFTAVVMAVLAWAVEAPRWRPMPPATMAAMLFNAVIVIGLAHTAWFYLARTLPPVASGLSVMMIPVLGVFSGAAFLGEALHAQDLLAMALMVTAIALVVWKRG